MPTTYPEILARILRFRSTNDIPQWNATIADAESRKTRFAEFVSKVPIFPELIFYESMSGARMMDSPFAIFQYLNDSKVARYRNHYHVWSVGSIEVVPNHLRNLPNVIFVKRHTSEYMYLLARSKYVISNSVLPEYFVRRTDQLYLNTWHGIGYKSLGRTATAPLGAALTVINMLQATHVITPCEMMTRVHLDGLSMSSAFVGKLAETGYPRIDTTLNMSDDEKTQLRQDLGIRADRKTLLYAPTWRADSEDGAFDFKRLEADLLALSALDANIVFMGHHIMLRKLSNVNLANVIVPKTNTNSNKLLAISDILMTDYSSIFFDYLVTGKAIIHYLYDYATYKSERGLSLELDDFPGEIALTSDEMLSSVTSALRSNYIPTPPYQRAVERFCPHDSGNSTQHVVEWFFEDSASNVRLIPDHKNKPRIAFWGGRLDDSEDTRIFLDEIRTAIQRNDFLITLVIARSAGRIPQVHKALLEFGFSISIVARANYTFAMTSDEARARETLSVDSLPESRELYRDIYRREYRRMFGDTRFDETIKFKGLTRFWVELAKYSLN